MVISCLLLSSQQKQNQTLKNFCELKDYDQKYQIEMTLQCRTCASVIYNTNAKNIFDTENTEILEHIEMVTGIAVSKIYNINTNNKNNNTLF